MIEKQRQVVLFQIQQLKATLSMLDYKKWYCGHYHTRKQIDKMQFMFEDFDTMFIRL